MFVSTAHAAASLHHRPFAGVTFDESRYQYKTTPSFHDWNEAVGIFGGYRWTDFGVQASAQYMRPIHARSNTTPVTVDVHAYNFALDGLYFYKLCNRLEWKSLLGLGVMTNHFSVKHYDGLGSATTTGVGARVGTGLQYQFTDHFVGEAMVKGQYPGNKAINNVVGVSLGVAYVF